ncbi:MAG: bifunctional ornithine acetyltransferase/N-acetylglutamate synthase, partial [Phycisphaeraceae bacterium]
MTTLSSITLPKGFRAAGGTAGLKPSGKPDLALIVADQPCPWAAVFTQNKVCGAPVTVGREHP